MEWIVMTAMHAKGEYPGLLFKKLCRTVALVDIQVDDQQTFGYPPVQEIIGGYRKIIQQTKSLAPVGKSMVSASCDVQRHTIADGMMTTVDGALCDHQLSPCQ